MGLFDWFPFRNKSPASGIDVDDLFVDYQKIYLKLLAIDKSAEFVSRIFSKAEFHFLKADKLVDSPWSYLLNVKPNLNEEASRFWQRAIYQLIVKNEVLIFLSDDDQLLIADSFIRKESAFYGDTFESIVVKGYQLKRSFKRSDVIFIQYNNKRLDEYVSQLFDDYHKLYDRLVEAIARNNQIRGTLHVKGAAQFDKEKTAQLKKYSERLFTAFKDKSVAIVPMIDQIEYSELTNKIGVSNISVDDLKKLKLQFEDEVADLVGIPAVVLHGEVAGIEEARKSFNTDCLRPLVKRVTDSITAGLITKNDYQKGYRIDIAKVIDRDILDLSTNIDKITSSGAFKVNEVRREVGYKPVEGGDVIIRTKNYEVAENKEKGDDNGNHPD
ncbi:TPA: phage portal protein [Streptococcus suis]|nr:phage portal protein [Streptococcus suis]HEM3895687.1 phage portal protein [Streptococcus suis]HEM3903856.1 phage portal protein [Streptococcus suis]